MASLEDAREGKAAVLADQSANVAGVDLDVRVTSATECRGLGIVDSKVGCFTTEPCCDKLV